MMANWRVSAAATRVRSRNGVGIAALIRGTIVALIELSERCPRRSALLRYPTSRPNGVATVH
jgi:hypothetical protein